MSKDKSLQCCLGIWGIAAAVGLIWFLSVITGFAIINNYTEEDCIIIDVVTPQQLPMANNTNNWIDCDCGKRCTTKTPCEKIILNIPDGSSNVVAQKHTISEKSNGKECTFKRGDCDEWGLYDRMIASQNSIKKYSDMKKNNESIKCYVNEDKNEAFLGNDIDMTQVIASSVLFGVSTILFLILVYFYNKKDSPEKSENNKQTCIFYKCLPCKKNSVEQIV